MTDDEINIALCEIRGWTHASEPCLHSSSVTEHYWWRPERKGMVMFDYKVCTQRMFPSGEVVGRSFPAELPDHLNGIEALGNIHEVEKLLTDVQQLEYWAALDEVCGHPAVLFYMVHAKARKRAEALLRTLGKWKE